MSADNRILICHWPRWSAPNDQWRAWHASASADYCEPPDSAKHFATELEACTWAGQEAERGYLEYGIQKLTVDEQITGLTYLIEDAAKRLACLRWTGCQFEVKSEDDDGRIRL